MKYTKSNKNFAVSFLNKKKCQNDIEENNIK